MDVPDKHTQQRLPVSTLCPEHQALSRTRCPRALHQSWPTKTQKFTVANLTSRQSVRTSASAECAGHLRMVPRGRRMEPETDTPPDAGKTARHWRHCFPDLRTSYCESNDHRNAVNSKFQREFTSRVLKSPSEPLPQPSPVLPGPLTEPHGQYASPAPSFAP